MGGVGGAALALITLTSCASLSPDAAAASDVVSRFSAAVVAGDGEAACDLLTEPAQRSVAVQSGTGCASGIVSLGLDLDDPPGDPEAYGTSAFVPLGDGAAFLTAAEDGWLVRAIGCVPQGEAPFLCVVDGS
ncbi:hypothetical protein B5808_17155 [Cnuibacter physcomitrellae]|uniref:Uncharacterized protein n=1 Tax=Cnuibacter physcomitrellae TaxID=1619308 RepID=A0A1X9LR10_9MICO|nr:hypothetical protein B5808_17155 [Cnuibacter physcomitrellae]